METSGTSPFLGTFLTPPKNSYLLSAPAISPRFSYSTLQTSYSHSVPESCTHSPSHLLSTLGLPTSRRWSTIPSPPLVPQSTTQGQEVPFPCVHPKVIYPHIFHLFFISSHTLELLNLYVPGISDGVMHPTEPCTG